MFYAHTFDGGENWCVLDASHHIVSDDDMGYGDAHKLADKMNDADDEESSR